MTRFIDEHSGVYGVEPICKQLPIAPSNYRQHAARLADPTKRPARAQRDAVLCARIQQAWEANFNVYGDRKLWRELRRHQVDVARCTVERLMKTLGILAVYAARR